MKPSMQWKRQHLFDRAVRPMCLIVFAAPRGSPQYHPVRRPITGPAKSLRIDEGFQKIDRVPVGAFPILRNLAGHAAEDVRRQMRDSDPRPNQKARVVGEESDGASPGLAPPAGEVVPPRQVPPRRTPRPPGHRPPLPPHRILQVLAHRLSRIMLTVWRP